MIFRWHNVLFVLLLACAGIAVAQEAAVAETTADVVPGLTDEADPGVPPPLAEVLPADPAVAPGPEVIPGDIPAGEVLPPEVLPPEVPTPGEPAPAGPTEAVQPQASAPTPPPVAVDDDSTRSTWMFILSAVLAVTLVLIVVLLIKRGREARSDGRHYVAEAYLRDISGSTTQGMYKLGSKPVMLGRVGGKDVDFLDYIVVPSATIGRRHALIEFKDFGYWIMDQGSINGTFVNNRAVTSEVRLKHGDRIRLHKLEFEFVMPEVGDSVTVLAADAPRAAAAVAAAAGPAAPMPEFELELEADAEPAAEPEEENLDALRASVESEEATLLPGNPAPAPRVQGGEDETLMPAGGGSGDGAAADGTLLPGVGTAGHGEERPEKGAPKKKGDEFFDITGGDF